MIKIILILPVLCAALFAPATFSALIKNDVTHINKNATAVKTVIAGFFSAEIPEGSGIYTFKDVKDNVINFAFDDFPTKNYFLFFFWMKKDKPRKNGLTHLQDKV